jgi:hypothetical protein
LLAEVGFLIQSILSFSNSVFTFSSSLSSMSSFSAPMKFVPLSQRISRTGPLLQMNLLN